MNTRPHLMVWRTQDGEAGETPEGYPIPGNPGQDRQAPCRYHDSNGGNKEFKNEDSTVVRQVGTIRCDVGEIPTSGTIVTVFGDDGNIVFKGPVRDVFKGQLSHRLEV